VAIFSASAIFPPGTVIAEAAEELIRHHGIKPEELEHILRRARDEAHRFAITYHKKLREISLK